VFRVDGYGGVHLREHVEKPGAARIESRKGSVHARPGHQEGGHQKVRRRRYVAGNRHVGAHRSGAAANRNRIAVPRDGRVHRLQHDLGVIARRHPLDHRRLSIREQAGDQERRLHLRAGHGHLVLNAVQRAAFDHGRQRAPVGECHASAHSCQRFRDPNHGATSQRGVAVDAAARRACRRESGQQTCRRPGVAGVHVELPGERIGHYDGSPVGHRLDETAHDAKRIRRGLHVRRVGESVDGLASACGRAQNQRAV